MPDDLLLISGNDIPFIEARVNIHQPRIEEIAYIGENCFFASCELINFSKDMLTEEDKVNLEGLTNFDILMSIIQGQNPTAQQSSIYFSMLLTLLFPQYKVQIENNQIKLINNKNQQEHFITNENFESFRQIINLMFSFDNNKDNFNPSGDLAKKISDKFKKRHQKLQENKNQENISIISRYISILTVGEHKDMNSFMKYTVYQLFDEFKRYELKMSFDINFQARLAGAKDLKDAEDWMKDIHE